MAQKIGDQHGLEARRLQENKLHPGLQAWDKSCATFKTLVVNNNEFVDDIAELKAWRNALLSRPF